MDVTAPSRIVALALAAALPASGPFLKAPRTSAAPRPATSAAPAASSRVGEIIAQGLVLTRLIDIYAREGGSPAWSPEDERDMRARRDRAWYAIPKPAWIPVKVFLFLRFVPHLLRPTIMEGTEFGPWIERIEKRITERVFDDLLREIPPEWYADDLDALLRLAEQLYRRRALVPELLLAAKNTTRHPFPNWM